MNAKTFIEIYEKGGTQEMKELFDKTDKNAESGIKSDTALDKLTLFGTVSKSSSSVDKESQVNEAIASEDTVSEVPEKDISNDDLESELINQEINFSDKGTVNSAAEELELPDNVDLTGLEDEDGDSDVIPFPTKRGRTREEFDAQCEAQKNRSNRAANHGRTKEDFEKSDSKSGTLAKPHTGRTRADFDRQCEEQLQRRKEKADKVKQNFNSTEKKNTELFNPDNFDLSKDETGFKPDSCTIPNSEVDLNNTIILSFPEGTKANDEDSLVFTKGKYTYVVNLTSEKAKEDCVEALRENTHRSFAWYKEKTGNKNWVLYDVAQYEVEGKAEMFLKAKAIPAGILELPVNASSCCKMFAGLRIDGSISFSKAFNTANIISMCSMFENAKFTKAIYFPTTFSSKSLRDSRYMFRGAKIHIPFKFTDSFNLNSVLSAEQMFCEAKSYGDFSLPKTFSPGIAKSLSGMFSRFSCDGNFALPEAFDTSKVEDFSRMFSQFKFPADFVLPKYFSTVNAKNLSSMFYRAELPINENIVEGFDTQNCTDFNSMFLGVNFPDNFVLPKSFSTANGINMLRMFYGCTFPKGFILPETFSTEKATNISELFCKCTFKSAFSLPPAFSIEGDKKRDFLFYEAKGTGVVDLGVKHVVKVLHARYLRNKSGLETVKETVYNGMDLPSFIKKTKDSD